MKNKYNAILKKLIVICMFIVILIGFVPTSASEKTYIEKADGSGYVTLRGKSEYVEVNKVYENKDTEFRAVWVSPLVGNINEYSSKEQYKREILSIINTMEHYNLNVMIFHVRIMNDALYPSEYNNWSTYYNTNPDWDALPWIIEECHKRGIEFHAWMNPYRVTKSVNTSLETIAKGFPSVNPASDPKNMLVGANSVILNPGLAVVRNFLIKTCMEVVRNYDVDAIHFDDYFYDSKVDDSATRKEQNISDSLMPDWRREQVNKFIEALSKAIRNYNTETGKYVQLGISPSGVWKSGNGKVEYDNEGNAITNGSNTTTSFIHYGDYLYSDTLHWINEEWIDYILPQAYWAIEHPMCAFYDLMDWWSKVVKYKKVNLYSGYGLYQQSSTGGYSWYTNPYEAYNETMICNTLENVKGIALYDYNALKATITNPNYFKGMEELWKYQTILPEIPYAEKIVPEKITDLTATSNSVGNLLSWKETDDAKFYVVYRSEHAVSYKPTEVIDVIGHLSYEDKIEYTDTTAEKGKKYYYAVKAQSNSLTLGEGDTCQLDLNDTSNKLGSVGEFDVCNIADGLIPGGTALVRWNKLDFPFGNTIKYEVSYSINEGSEIKIDESQYKLNNEIYSVTIPTDFETTSIKVKVRAYNNVGETVKVFDSKVDKGLGKISNITFEGKEYANQEVTFKWNKLQEEDVSYKLQYSYDMITWTDINKKIEKGDFLYQTTCTFENYVGSIYYRVVGVKDNKYGYSDVISLNLKKSLGELSNLKVNNEDMKDYYLVEEADNIIITFDAFNKTGIEYNVYVSSDLVNWKIARQYSSGFKVTSTNGVVTAKLPISYSPLKVYLKVVAINTEASTESEIFTVYAIPYENFFEDVIAYFDIEVKTSIKELDIYN